MTKYIKLFDLHDEYVDYIEDNDKILPNVSFCEDSEDVHYNPMPSVVKLTFTLNQTGRERISLAGSGLDVFGILENSAYTDGLSNVKSIKIDGVEIDMENDITKEEILSWPDEFLIEGYFYDFTTTGEHTIEYTLKTPNTGSLMCALFGDIQIDSQHFYSGITDASVEFDNVYICADSSFAYSSAITSVNGSVRKIGKKAFYGDANLESVDIDDNLIRIYDSAFMGCDSLSQVSLPETLLEIEDDAFKGCTSLPVEGNIRYADFCAVEAVNKTLTSYVIKEDTKFIHSEAFKDCENATTINMPEEVIGIGYMAFAECRNLTGHLMLPSTLKYIGAYAFHNCENLTGSIVIPNTMNIINNGVFSGCSSFTNLVIPNTIVSIGNDTFNYCQGLTGTLEIPNSVETIGDAAFRDCIGFTGVPSISQNIESIGDNAFNGCRGFTGTLSLPNKIQEMGITVFANCSGLTSVNIPESLHEIKESTFINCTSLASVTLPNTLISIENSAFENCSALSSITCNASVAPIIASDVFVDIGEDGTLYVPTGSAGYDVWMSVDDDYLGKYNWTKVEQ